MVNNMGLNEKKPRYSVEKEIFLAYYCDNRKEKCNFIHNREEIC